MIRLHKKGNDAAESPCRHRGQRWSRVGSRGPVRNGWTDRL